LRTEGPDAVRARHDKAKKFNGRAADEPSPYNAASAANWRATAITAKDLRYKSFPMLKYILPGLIPAEGFHLLIAKAKVGKTWLMQDVGLATSGDRYVLGNMKPEQGDVLYLALEDNQRRLRGRLAKLLPDSQEWPEGFTVVTSWRRLNEGGLDDLREWIKEAKNPRLIVIDVLKMIRPTQQKNRNTQLYDSDYDFVAPLRELASQHHIAIVGIHHARKAEADDPIDMISGSGGLAAAADTILMITRGANGVTLHVRGRDVESADLAIEFNKSSCRWSLLGTAAEVKRSDERQRILAALTEEGEPLTPGQLAEIINVKRNNVAKLLGKMYRDGDVEKPKGKRGHYGLPENPPPNGNGAHAPWRGSPD
jgi:AAA domain